MEVTAYGQYAVKIANTINFMINYSGNRDTVVVSDIEVVLAPLLETSLATVLGTLTVSFDEIAAKQMEISKTLTNSIDEYLVSLRLEISKLSLPSITPTEEVVESIRNAASKKIEGFATADVEANLIQKKAGSINTEEADIYTKINTAEAIKDFANNESGSGGWSIYNYKNYLFGIYGGYILRYDIIENKVDKFLDASESYKNWPVGITCSSDGRYCILNSFDFVGDSPRNYFLIDFEEDTVELICDVYSPEKVQVIIKQKIPIIIQDEVNEMLEFKVNESNTCCRLARVE